MMPFLKPILVKLWFLENLGGKVFLSAKDRKPRKKIVKKKMV